MYNLNHSSLKGVGLVGTFVGTLLMGQGKRI